MPAMETLTPTARRALRAQAHGLNPVVIIGHSGLTPAVMHEIDVNLLAHELIKVRVANDDRDEREAWLANICQELGAAPVQHIGKLLVLYRPRPAETEPAAPARAGRKAVGRESAKRGTGKARAKGPAGNQPASTKPGAKRLVPSSEREVSAAARRRRGQDVGGVVPAEQGNRRRQRSRA
ncbi:RNA-binding protein [Burkholderiales bacterium]|nr:RNA-binding protein [Burkholderiales bacterium]